MEWAYCSLHCRKVRVVLSTCEKVVHLETSGITQCHPSKSHNVAFFKLTNTRVQLAFNVQKNDSDGCLEKQKAETALTDVLRWEFDISNWQLLVACAV